MMMSVEISGCGLVREPQRPAVAVFILSVTRPQQSWIIYRKYQSFKALSEHVRKLVPSLQPCPVLSAECTFQRESLNRARMELSAWMQHVMLYATVRDSPVFRRFLMDGANASPPYLDVQWAQGVAQASGPVAGGAYHGGDEDGDDMEMDDLFDSHHTEKDVALAANEEEDHELSHATDDEDFQDDDLDDSQHAMDCLQKSAPTAETVFYNSDIDNEDDDEGCSMAQSMGGGGDRYMASYGSTNGVTVGGGSAEGMDEGGSRKACGPCRKRASLDSFKIIKVIGKGSFGKVFLVRETESGRIYAMKVLTKENIIKRNQVEHTKTERNVLGYVKHPFIVGLNMAFQTKDKLFFVLDYCAGGELFFHLGKLGKFPEARARFYAAEITLALEHVHKLDIIYRDLKPENVLLDARGHVRLTDFGLSKEGISGNSSGAHSFCGTPEYLAPEILNRQGHGRAVDWWSLGALLYEMLTGLPPFYCRDREKLFEKIRTADLTFPKFVSDKAQSLLSGLLTRDPTKRLGSSEDDAAEVKRHPFFAGEVNWEHLMKGELPPPWEPTVCGSLDTSQFDKEFTSMPIFSPDARETARFGVSHDETFAGFTFTDDSMMQAAIQHHAARGAHDHGSYHHHLHHPHHYQHA